LIPYGVLNLLKKVRKSPTGPQIREWPDIASNRVWEFVTWVIKAEQVKGKTSESYTQRVYGKKNKKFREKAIKQQKTCRCRPRDRGT